MTKKHIHLGRKAAKRSGALGKALDRVSTLTDLAEHLGLTVQAISRWRRVPGEHCAKVEQLTGVPRWELRPDLYGDWPGRKRSPATARAASA